MYAASDSRYSQPRLLIAGGLKELIGLATGPSFHQSILAHRRQSCRKLSIYVHAPKLTSLYQAARVRYRPCLRCLVVKVGKRWSMTALLKFHFSSPAALWLAPVTSVRCCTALAALLPREQSRPQSQWWAATATLGPSKMRSDG